MILIFQNEQLLILIRYKYYFRIGILPLTHSVEQYYANIRTHLEEQGTPIGGNDLLIAAHSLHIDLTLVSANVREFSRVPNLKLENWLQPD